MMNEKNGKRTPYEVLFKMSTFFMKWKSQYVKEVVCFMIRSYFNISIENLSSLVTIENAIVRIIPWTSYSIGKFQFLLACRSHFLTLILLA